ncbi:MAG: hypothetical protein HXY30_16815 [Pseudorhodoplanes sp.]|nr:hypothetical protein [Pseudorhodoplanes sp.]
MNKQLDQAIARLRDLPEERQQEAAELLFDFLNGDLDVDVHFTPEQLEEIDRCLSADEPFATDEEVRDFFAKFSKPR